MEDDASGVAKTMMPYSTTTHPIYDIKRIAALASLLEALAANIPDLLRAEKTMDRSGLCLEKRIVKGVMPRRKKRTTVPGTSEGAPKSPEKEKGIREEPGFPDDALEMLISAVDTIVLCVDEGKLIQVPEGCASSLDRRRVYTNPKTLVARKEALANMGVLGAVFAGCAPFSSSKPYRRAAMLVLATARFLYIIHNKDNVCKLASWFSALTDLMLPHNLNFRSICSRQDCEGHSARKSSLERIEGDAPALGSTSLELDKQLLSECLLMLPKIVSVHSALDAVLHNWDVVSSDGVVLDDMKTAYLSKCPEVVLGSWRELPGLARSHRETGVAEIECARRFCPAVRKLEAECCLPKLRNSALVCCTE
ncbi:uncharacterized protein LOC119165198 isoform X4 [Rhipicephalus microplus]|uniref:uncharacterized protein LOC119165198 isoform X4 n=1 Tax=Rhipicephalus microplus TaxID=6941 RepID=UPI003F6CE2B8